MWLTIRLRYGLLWKGSYPSVKRFVVACILLILTMVIVADKIQSLRTIDKLLLDRFHLTGRLSDKYFSDVAGSPCTLRADYVNGKCVETKLKPLPLWWSGPTGG